MAEINGILEILKNGTVHAKCLICWNGPSGKYGGGWSADYDDYNPRGKKAWSPIQRARAGIRRHIRYYHVMEPVIREVGFD